MPRNRPRLTFIGCLPSRPLALLRRLPTDTSPRPSPSSHRVGPDRWATQQLGGRQLIPGWLPCWVDAGDGSTGPVGDNSSRTLYWLPSELAVRVATSRAPQSVKDAIYLSHFCTTAESAAKGQCKFLFCLARRLLSQKVMYRHAAEIA